MNSDVGVLFGKGEALPDRAAPALAALSAQGLTSPGPAVTGLIRLALVHQSFLYENKALLPGVSAMHLAALAGAGNAFQQRQTAIDAYWRYGASGNGLLHRECNRVAVLFHEWAAGIEWLRASALLGKTFSDGQALPRKATTNLLQQVIGILCLAGEDRAAAGLLTDLHVRAYEDQGISDPKTLLQEILPFELAASFNYEVSRIGPDHGSTFHAVLSDAGGRRGVGDGANKTAACQAAALDLIQTHFADLFTLTKPEAAERRTPGQVVATESHVRQVMRLKKLFELPDSARGLLSQALIHKSWAYENAKAMRESGQQDNSTLAFVGSCALSYEYRAAAARAMIGNEGPEGQGIATPKKSTYAEAFLRTGCADGMLLGVGQLNTTGISTELASEAFQAIFAAISVGREFPASLENSWPVSWSSVWELIAPAQSRQEIPNTVLNYVAKSMDLSVKYEIEHKGPEHARWFRCALLLESNSAGRSMNIKGEFAHSKNEARASAAGPVLAVLSALADEQPVLTDEGTEKIAQFLTVHQASVFSSGSYNRRQWIQYRLFGQHFLGAPGKLVAWAEAMDRLVGDEIVPGAEAGIANGSITHAIRTAL